MPTDFWLIGPIRGQGGQLNLHWLTPFAHGHCDYVAPGGDAAEVASLRDRTTTAAIEDRWPAPIVEALRSLASRAHSAIRIRLAIGADAPAGAAAIARAWQRTPFEGLTLDGTPVTECATLEREHSVGPHGSAPARGDATVLNTWYALNEDEPDRVIVRRSEGIHVRLGFLQLQDVLAHERDLRSLGSLTVIAHGAHELSSQYSADGTFLVRATMDTDSFGVPWTLPAVTLPPLVVILACCSDRLELVDYASTLLQRGSRCVLVPAGRVDASRAAAFIGDFLERWHGGESVFESIDALRITYHHNLLDRLWILGDSALRYVWDSDEVTGIPPGELHTQQLQKLLTDESTRAQATSALADRATLGSILSTGSLRDAINILNRSLGIEDYGDEAGRRLHRQLDEAYPSCAPVTRGWLANYMMGLSERYDHAAMRRYRYDRDRDKGASCGVPVIMHFAAVAEAREGQFIRSSRSLYRGFDILRQLGEDVPVDRLTLTGTVVNHVIDFNLPCWSATIVGKMLTELSAMDGDDAAWLEFIAGDRLSRAALRGGRSEDALAAMIGKRNEALARGENGLRELAWLVYIGAWHDRSLSRTQINWVEEAVRAATALGRVPGKDPAAELAGNDDLSYLLRALAAWHWARPDSALSEMLEPWIGIAEIQIEVGSCDPGPWGFILGYLAATGSVAAAAKWNTARAHLLKGDYLLEVLGLEGICGLRSPDQAALLQKFASTRAEVIRILAPVLSSHTLLGTGADLEGELRRRARVEMATIESLPENVTQRKQVLLASGVLPM